MGYSAHGCNPGKETIVNLYGKSTKGIELDQTTPEEKEEALRLLEEIEREVENDDDDDAVFELDEETSRKVRVKMDGRIIKLIKATDVKRQLQEEVRANHRNFNRMMTLVVAIVLGFVVTYFFQQNGFPILGWHHALEPAQAKVISGYSFVITVLLDAGLAAYALVKHY